MLRVSHGFDILYLAFYRRGNRLSEMSELTKFMYLGMTKQGLCPECQILKPVLLTTVPLSLMNSLTLASRWKFSIPGHKLASYWGRERMVVQHCVVQLVENVIWVDDCIFKC